MANLLMDDDTIAAMHRYKDFFAFGGVDVEPALEALPRAMRLARLKRKLDRASELVQRHIIATSEPVVGVASDVRRMVVGTPVGSAVRDAFSDLDARWSETFKGGRTPARAEEPVDPSKDPNAPK